MSIPQRYQIMGDGSGHDYFVPVGQEKQFEDWVEFYASDSIEEYDGLDFDSNRIDGNFTFTDPRCK